MSLRVEYHELVDLDLLNAWNWYEDQERGRSPGHAGEFQRLASETRDANQG